jgi:hypothetical protein
MIVGFGALFSNQTFKAGQENPGEKNLATHMYHQNSVK